MKQEEEKHFLELAVDQWFDGRSFNQRPSDSEAKECVTFVFKQETQVLAILEEKTGCEKRETAQSYDKGKK